MAIPHAERIRPIRASKYLSRSLRIWGGQHERARRRTAPWRQGLRLLFRRTCAEEGQSIVEFALTFLVFIFLVFAVFDFGHLFFVEMDVQNAIQEAARYGSTGNHLPNPQNPTTNLSRVTSIIDTLENNATGVQFASISVSSATGGSGSGGGPGDMLTVSATVNMPLMTPLISRLFANGQYTFTASITVKNEPFPPSDTN